jgi:hypothetical protein
VTDEAHTHRGIPAIGNWLGDAREKYVHRLDPLSVRTDGAHAIVVARVSGNFPGSPIELTHVFELAGERIRSQRIG